MTLPTPDDARIFVVKDWLHSANIYLAPTLILPCGLGNDLEQLQKGVNRRLDLVLAKDIVRWAPALDPLQVVKPGQIQEAIAPLLELGYWQELVDGGYVAHMPDDDHPMKIQLLVVCRIDDTTQDGMAEWLNKLASAVTSSNVSERVAFTMALLILGEPTLDLEKIQVFWPRFCIGKKAWGGAQVSHEHVLQVCQNAILSLSTSEFGRFIELAVGKKKKNVRWISLGVSAILTDVQAIRERFASDVLSQFTNSLVPESLSDDQKKMLDGLGEEKRKEFHSNLLRGIKTTAESIGWKIDTAFDDYDAQTIENKSKPEPGVLRNKSLGKGCYLSPSSRVAMDLFQGKPAWWLNEKYETSFIPKTWPFYQRFWGWLKFGWGQFVDLFQNVPLPDTSQLEDLLAVNYQDLFSRFKLDLREPASQEYGNLLDILIALIERRGYTGKLFPLDMIEKWPQGFRAAGYFSTLFEEKLTRSPIFLYDDKPVEPAGMDGEKFSAASARSDLSTINEAVNRYRRFHAKIISPIGVFLKLIVAWPLLIGALELFVNWNQVSIFTLSAIALITIGVGQLVYWRLKDRRMLMWVRAEINACFSKRVLSFAARVMQDYRLRVAARLPDIQKLISELAHEFEEENLRVSQECMHYSKQGDAREDGVTYRVMAYEQVLGTRPVLVNEEYEWKALAGETAYVWDDPESSKTVLSWKSEAKRSANTAASQRSDGKYEKAETGFVVTNVLPLLEKPKLARTIVVSLQKLSDQFASLEFKPHLLTSYALADKNENLKSGLKWNWLYQHAHPLGGDVKHYSLFTLISVSDQAPLGGATGSNSEYWPKDAHVIISRQTNEIGCVRGVIEWA